MIATAKETIMARFFTSPTDLAAWVMRLGATKAATVIVNLPKVGEKHVADIVETTKRIVDASDANAAGVLYDLLKVAGVTEDEVAKTEDGVEQVRAANELLAGKVITADDHTKMVKQAQIMRQPGQYDMPLRLCPKLPWSVGKKLISTYNCRHYCIDGIVLDDDPMRVYCGELLWRRHVADKFSSDQQDRKTGELVGGYINERFYKFPDAGTPANPDVPRDGGNPMALKPGERTRQPRPHQWSTERRMQEAREKGSTKNLMIGKAASMGWVGRMIEAQVSVDNVRTNSSASGFITKGIRGTQVELEWTAIIYSADEHRPDEVEFQWPENMMMGIEQTPGSWGGDVCDPDTGEMLVDGTAREQLESEWENEVLNAIAANQPVMTTASSGVKIVTAQNKGVCKMCGQAIQSNGSEWSHVDGDLEHVAVPQENPKVAQNIYGARGGRYVDFSFAGSNLVITPTTEGVEYAREHVASGDTSDNAFMTMIEDQLANGWKIVSPEEIGALTSALIITNDYQKDDHGTLTDIGDAWSNIAFYQVRSELQDFAEGKSVTWEKAPATERQASVDGKVVEAEKKGKSCNPWAVCHTTVDKDKNPGKYERCVKDVKEGNPVKESEEDTAKKVILAAGRQNFVRISAKQVTDATSGDEEILKAFSMAVDLKNEGVADDEAIIRVSDATGMPMETVAGIQSAALQKLAAHVSDVYVTEPKQEKKGPKARSDADVQADAETLGLNEA